MAIRVNLAMTGSEIRACRQLPANIAWMACHFSLYSRGLWGLPQSLPPGSLLILDDQLPWWGHDGARICEELDRCIRETQCSGLLLDFQRPGITEVSDLVGVLCEALPCPVAVSALYAEGNGAAVFLPPPPCHVRLGLWTAPWEGREQWLELALDREVITLTDRGAEIFPRDFEAGEGFEDKKLHSHYRAAVEEDRAVFSLWRTRDDLADVIEEAEALGIKYAVGLYQELLSF